MSFEVGRRHPLRNTAPPCGRSELPVGQTATDWKHRDFVSLVASFAITVKDGDGETPPFPPVTVNFVAGNTAARNETPSLRSACDEPRGGKPPRRETLSF
jgi:hypothetical protein